MNLETRVYKMLLQAYPKDFRLEFGEEMLQVFRLQMKSAKLEKRTLMFWISAFVDCVCAATRERFSGKGESMNWWQKAAVLLSIIGAFENLIFLLTNTFRLINSTVYFDSVLMSYILNIFNFLRISIVYIAMFFSLPKTKFKLEIFGIIICSIVIIQNILFFILNGFTLSQNNTMFPLFQTTLYLIGFLSIVFARVKLGGNRLNFDEVPTMTKFFTIGFLANFAIPFLIFLLNQGGNSNSQSFLILTSSIGNLALAFGIWRSSSSQTNTPNLASSL